MSPGAGPRPGPDPAPAGDTKATASPRGGRRFAYARAVGPGWGLRLSVDLSEHHPDAQTEGGGGQEAKLGPVGEAGGGRTVRPDELE